MFVFFFKQKTAYEMRISDWSSDVCSSDLSYSSFPRNAPPAPSSRAGGNALLLPGARHPFPDRAAKDLPGRVARQGRDDLHRFRRLEAGQPRAAPAAKLVLAECLARLEHAHHMHRLAPPLVGTADPRRPANGWEIGSGTGGARERQ